MLFIISSSVRQTPLLGGGIVSGAPEQRPTLNEIVSKTLNNSDFSTIASFQIEENQFHKLLLFYTTILRLGPPAFVTSNSRRGLRFPPFFTDVARLKKNHGTNDSCFVRVYVCRIRNETLAASSLGHTHTFFYYPWGALAPVRMSDIFHCGRRPNTYV